MDFCLFFLAILCLGIIPIKYLSTLKAKIEQLREVDDVEANSVVVSHPLPIEENKNEKTLEGNEITKVQVTFVDTVLVHALPVIAMANPDHYNAVPCKFFSLA